MRQIPSLRPNPNAGPSLNPPDSASVYDCLNTVCELIDEVEGEFVRERAVEIIGEWLCSPQDSYAKAKRDRLFDELVSRCETAVETAVEQRRQARRYGAAA